MKKILTGIVMVLLLAFRAQAATVSFSPSVMNVGVGQIFSVDIVGSFTAGETIEGGGLNLGYTPGTLMVDNVTVNTTLFDFYSEPGVIDNPNSAVSNIVFNTFDGASGNFLIATLTLTKVGTGTGVLTLSEASINPFSSASAGSSLVVGFGSATINAVPLPAAGWLLLSGLGCAGLVKKRKT